jgi:undecaprenyl-diphosphatase
MTSMNIFQAFILSLVEGITEFLPISSTGHMILASELLGVEQNEFAKSFEIIIQFGAILSVVFLYFQRILRNRKFWPQIIAAFIPTGVIGFLGYKLIKTFLLGNSWVVVASLFFGGLLMLLLENYFEKQQSEKKDLEAMTLTDALMVGTFQNFAVIPGVSRSMSTIFAGLWRGLNRKAAVEFSFILAIPTMAAATGYDLLKSGMNFSGQEFQLLAVGFVGAFLSAFAAVKYFLKFVEKHSFRGFAYYRIILAILFALFVL